MAVLAPASLVWPKDGTLLLLASLAAWFAACVLYRSRERQDGLLLRDDLRDAADQYARQGYWEFDGSTGEFTLSDNLHLLLGDPDRRLKPTLPILAAMVHPRDRDRLETEFRRMLDQGSHGEVEFRINGLDGKERVFWVTGACQQGRDGRAVRAFGISQDITERKAIEAAFRVREDHYRHAVELSPLISWVEDMQGNTVEVSPRWSELTGLPIQASLGKGWTEAIHPDDLLATETQWQVCLETGQPYDVEHRVLIADGTYRWFRARASARMNDEGEILCWYGTVEDVHDRKLAEIALRASEAFASSILVSTTDCVRVLDLEGRLQYMNPPGRLSLEIDDFDSYIGRESASFWPEEERPKLWDALAVARAGGLGRFTARGPTARGTLKWWDVVVSPIPGPDGQPARLLVTSRDVTVSKATQDELEHARKTAEFAALHDSLTGLPNRARFRDCLERAIQQGAEDRPVALLFLDLDEFKSVNDSLGHPAGDSLLQEAARRLRDTLPGTDLVARFGGDEFAILQTDICSTEQIDGLARRAIEVLSAPYGLQESEIVVGVSIGVAVAASAQASADDLLKQADIALYEAKRAGRGVYRFFEPAHEAAAEDAQRLRTDLHDALRKHEFRIYYQPVVEFRSSRIVGFEALLRWQHPRRGLVSPADFIPLAEITGAIEEIGAWVLQEACSLAAGWPGDLFVSVNLSPRQFRAQSLADLVRSALSTSGVAAERLQLEITESVLLQDDDMVARTLAQVRALGVRISIDDFGTGYSSLGYLRRFSVDNIKIDRNFVADLPDNPRTLGILRSVMSLGDDLGISLTAEGIEHPAQLDQLRSMGRHHGQGYIFSPAVPGEEIEHLIRGVQACPPLRTALVDRDGKALGPVPWAGVGRLQQQPWDRSPW